MLLAKLFLMSVLSFPSVSLAMGHIESNMNPQAVGDSGRSKGAFQVQGAIWGKVPKSFLGQINQHNQILTRLVSDHHDLKRAIREYNGKGESARRYAKLVLRKALEIEILEV